MYASFVTEIDVKVEAGSPHSLLGADPNPETQSVVIRFEAPVLEIKMNSAAAFALAKAIKDAALKIQGAVS